MSRGSNELADALRSPVAAPDQTDAIMGRLGFVRTSSRDARVAGWRGVNSWQQSWSGMTEIGNVPSC